MFTRIKRFFTPPVFEGDEDKTRDVALLHIILWTAFGVIVGAAPILILNNQDWRGMTAGAAVVAAFVVPVLWLIRMSHRGHVRRASILFSSLIVIVVTVAIFIFGGLRTTTTASYLLAIFLAGLLLGWRAAFVFFLLSMLAATGVLLSEHYGIEFVSGVTVPVFGIQGAAGFDELFMLVALSVAMTVMVSLARHRLVTAIDQARGNERALADINRELQIRSDELQARTQDLDRRSRQLQAVAEIFRDITTARELDGLLNLAVALIRDRFDSHRVAVFLVDEAKKSAILRAASGEAGRRALEQGDQVGLGLEEGNLVSQAIDSGRLQIDLGETVADSTFEPETGAVELYQRESLAEAEEGEVHVEASPLELWSEVVLPLVAGERVIGALDVQRRGASVFGEDDAAVLQMVADQLAVAVENTRLLEEMQQALRELEAVSGRYTQEAWRVATRGVEGPQGYRYWRLGVEPTSAQPLEVRQAWLEGRPVVTQGGDDRQEAVSALAVPVKLREQVVGVLNLSYEGGSVPPEMVSLVEEIANRLALALENARLLQETRQRAQRDRLISDITTQVRASMDMERILQTAVRGLGTALGTDRAFVRLGAIPRRVVGTAPLNPEALASLLGDSGLADEGGDQHMREQRGQSSALADDKQTNEAVDE